MKNKYLYIQTFGCQMNVHDSEQMAALLAQVGYKITDNLKLADLILLNTCSIREKAAHKVYSELGRIGKLKEQNPELIIGVGGCLAQHLGTKFHKRVVHLDFVFGTHNIHRLPEMISSVESKREKITNVDFHKSLNSIGIYAPPVKGTVSAFVTIMQGCNNFCAYCVVPYLRGPEMSRKPEEIFAEIEKLVDHGIREVTLLGQNVNSYGKTLGNGLNFTALIKKIGKISGIERIRFMTSHPRDLSYELINCFAEEEKLCEHIHLPVQSGSRRKKAWQNSSKALPLSISVGRAAILFSSLSQVWIFSTRFRRLFAAIRLSCYILRLYPFQSGKPREMFSIKGIDVTDVEFLHYRDDIAINKINILFLIMIQCSGDNCAVNYFHARRSQNGPDHWSNVFSL